MPKYEKAVVEKIDVQNASFGESITQFKISIYDKLNKFKITEYGTFDSYQELELFAQQHGIEL